MRRRLLLCGSAWLWIGGCAAAPKPFLSPPEPAVVWPKPPDEPRVRYLGQLTGSEDMPGTADAGQVINELFFGPKAPQRMVRPYAVAVDAPGRSVAVADPGAMCVHVFDLDQRTYRRLSQADEAADGLRSPVGVAWSGEELWVADAAGPGVVIFGPAGEPRRLGTRELQRPAGIAAGAGGEIFVVDAGAHSVAVFDARGRLLRKFGENGTGPGQFNFPSHAACDADGHLWVADSLNFRIQRLSPAGEPLNLFGRKGDAAGDLALPKGIAVDRRGNIWVVDAQFENVQAFQPDGRLLLAFGGEGRGPGEFWLPAGACIDSRDRLWIADSNNGRVQVFQLLALD